MTDRFKGKVALVTGGRSGIGKAIASRFRDEGAHLFTLQRQADPNGDHILVDLADSAAIPTAIDELLAQTGGQLDILVNNAGMMQEAGIEEMDLAAWQQILAVNLTAPFLLIKAAMPALRKAGGAIINIGSIEGLAANPRHAAYCASKAGIHGLTQAVAVDHGADGVRCNTIAPGWIDTELNLDFIKAMPDPEGFADAIGDIHPLGRTGQPEEVAALASFLASEEASFITGQIYTVDGGRMAKLSLP